MAEVLVAYTVPTRAENGDLYWARALGRVAEGGLWQGWIEFTRAGDDDVVCTDRETSQPNKIDLVYWAQGLSATYLEGALGRALRPAPVLPLPQPALIVDSAPRSAPRRANRAPVGGRAVVLDPFLTYTEGEGLLANQLRALSHDHLRNIVEAYRFATPEESEWMRAARDEELVTRIVERVRERFVTATETAPAPEAARQSATPEDQSA